MKLKPKAAWQWRFVRVLLTLIIVYLFIVLAILFYQRNLIYFPTKLNPKLAEIMAEREGFTRWENKSGQLIGWKLSARTPATASVLILHGNAGCAIDRGYFAKPIRDAASADVYLLEYPGYGAREGSPSQKSFLAAGDEAFALLDGDLPIYIVSESLGTGLAAHLARTQGSKLAGLSLFVPFNNFAALAETKMPFLPVSLILWDRYDPESWLKNYSGPVKFILAENDEIIPSKFGQKLHDGFGGSKNLQIIAGAYHNDVCAQSPEWWKDVFLFWQQENGKGKLPDETVGKLDETRF